MFQKLRRNLERNLLGRDPLYNDPYEDPAEQFYARIYLKYLFEAIDTHLRHQSVKVLDLGCHTGRLCIPLAQGGHEVTAIDSSRFHIKRAEQHAREKKVSCHFLRGDGFHRIGQMPRGCFDLVLCTEVLYQVADPGNRMRELVRILRAGGMLATSHRTRFYYLTQAVQKRDYETARWILNHPAGDLWGSYFNWQTPEELESLYQELGLNVITMRPIGTVTGNGDEGMARLCNLAEVEDSRKEDLFDIEAFDSEEFSCLGRYLFVIGRKGDG